MNKLLVAFLLLFPFVVAGQITPAQNQLVQAPYGGFVYSPNSTATTKLFATTTPYFANFFFGNATGTTLELSTLCLSLDCRSTWPTTPADENWVLTNGYLTPTTTLGIGVFASSTIGSGAQAGGLTISGGATTTGNSYLAGGTITLPVDTNFVLSGGINGVSFDTNVLSVDATNNRVGIGTTAPGDVLDVQGGFINIDKFSGIKQDSVVVMFASSSPGNLATVLGAGNAGRNLRTSSSIISSTAIGWGALASASLSGTTNSAFGDRVLTVNTTGTRNNGIGGTALSANTTGDDNNAQGYQALLSLVSGSRNVAIGGAAMSQAKTSTDNTALGYTAGLFNNATSSVLIGSNAFRGVAGSASQNNVGIGYRAGFANTTGSNNVLIGYQAADTLTTGASNIILGYDIDVPAVSTSNYMSIGNVLFALNVSQTGSTVDTDALTAIGSTTPLATFQATTGATNATTSIQFGKANQNKGTCRTEYDTSGSPVYIYIAAGATAYTFQNGGTAPSGCVN